MSALCRHFNQCTDEHVRMFLFWNTIALAVLIIAIALAVRLMRR